MTNREIAEYTLAALKNSGADAAQCLVSRGKTDELNVDGGQFSLMRSLFNSSLSLKAIVGGKKGFAAINALDTASIDKAVKTCITAAENSVEDTAEIIAPLAGEKFFESGPLEADKEKLFERIEEFMQGIKKKYPKIITEQLISKHNHANSVYMNTNGTVFEYNHGNYDFECMFSAHEGETASSFNYYGILQENLNSPFLQAGMLEQLLKESEQQLNTTSVDGKFSGTIVVTPACAMDIFMSIFSNTISDPVIIDKTSEWKDKINQPVASETLSISSIPLDKRIVCGERFTSDGYISENYDIIKNGVLKSFALSQYAALKTNNKRAKNSSMNFEIAAGDKNLEEIIAGIDNGILLNRFSGGAPAINGDFSGVAKNSFLIKNGKIDTPVSETMISGNLLEMIKNVSGVSKETVCDGQSVFPWIAFDGVTVSGK